MAAEVPQTLEYRDGRLNVAPMLEFSKTSVPLYQSPFQNNSQPKFFSFSQQKPELRPTKDFEAKCNKVMAKLALLGFGASSSKSLMVKNKGLVVKAYEWDESTDDNEMVRVKVHTLLEMEDNGERNFFIDYLCIDLNYADEQRNNLMLKHRDLVQELNTCKEKLLVLKQAKLDFLTMQHANTEILKENQNLRKELKELTIITEVWLNSSNKVNQCISEQIPNQKKRILGSGQTDLVFVKSSADDTIVSIPGVERPYQGGSSLRSQTLRPLKPFPPCKHCGFNDHQSDNCVNYPTYEICGSYDHDTKGHKRIISLKRGIKPRNPQHVTKSYETYGSTMHTTTDHNDIEWFRRGKALQAKKAEALKDKKGKSSNANRSKTLTNR
ncbi:hypothetical protein Tco_1188920 [Tanacetum coccineum]